MNSHSERVQRIAQALRARSKSDGYASIEKAAVSHFVPSAHDPRHDDKKVDVRDLNHILELDVPGARCVAEPGVTFADLVKETLRFGLIPKLVPELKTITLGGAVAGCSVESMSYKYGGFHDSCRSYELITAEGEVLQCSEKENELLFGMIHGSYGTLGILAKLEFDLIPAKPYVHMQYRRFSTMQEYRAEMMQRWEAKDFDFMDGIIHAKDCFVLCLGNFVDSAPYTSDYTGVNIFYKSTRSRDEDYLTTYDYLFRYDTECHWLTRTLPGMENPVMRKALKKTLLGSTNLLTWAKKLRPVLKYYRDPNVVVDVFIPEQRFLDFVDWYKDIIDFYPLWIVPYQAPVAYPWIAEEHLEKMGGLRFVDCAVYGKQNTVPGVNFYKLLEDKTYELGGLKTLISQNNYEEKSFWRVYHKPNFEAVKQKTDPKNLFRGLYEKFHYARPESPLQLLPLLQKLRRGGKAAEQPSVMPENWGGGEGHCGNCAGCTCGAEKEHAEAEKPTAAE